MKLTLLFTFLYLGIYGFSQNKEALIIYNEAVEHYNKQEYDVAADLFTRSLDLSINKDTYFARALCYGKMSNKKDFCKDLAYASTNGIKKATAMFLKTCGTIDSAYINLNKADTNNLNITKVISYTTSDSIQYVFTKKDETVEINSLNESTEQPYVVRTIVESPPEFPGGIQAMLKFIQTNLQLPPSLRNGHAPSSIRVNCKFVVFEDGSIHDVFVLKCEPEYPECKAEAVRLISIMPRWKPALFEGQAVKSYFNIPVNFKVSY